MATDRRRAAAVLAAWLAVLFAPLIAAAAQTTAAEPWWVQLAFAGREVSAVRANGDTIDVAVAGIGQQESTDGGRTWQRHFERHGLVIPPGPRWRVENGVVGRVDGGGTWHADPGSPHLTQPAAADEHGLLAAPAALDGVVVAVDHDNVVWRRASDGTWARALLLLPQDIVAGPPGVTAVAAFETAPVSVTIYIATDGYSVLASSDGGDDWFRDDPGLPGSVRALAADATTKSLYAAAGDGLWVHHLRATPTPPAYADAALRWRWLGIALVTLAGAAVAIGGLLGLSARRPLS